MSPGTTLPENVRAAIRAGERALVARWWAATAFVALSAGAAWAVAGTLPARPAGEALTGTLHVAAVGLAALSLVARMRRLSDASLAALIGLTPGAPGAAEAGRADESGQWTSRLARLPEWAGPSLRLGWTCNGVIALLGAGLAVATGSPDAVWPFAFAGFVLNALAYPRLAPYVDRAAALAAGRI